MFIKHAIGFDLDNNMIIFKKSYPDNKIVTPTTFQKLYGIFELITGNDGNYYIQIDNYKVFELNPEFIEVVEHDNGLVVKYSIHGDYIDVNILISLIDNFKTFYPELNPIYKLYTTGVLPGGGQTLTRATMIEGENLSIITDESIDSLDLVYVIDDVGIYKSKNYYVATYKGSSVAMFILNVTGKNEKIEFNPLEIVASYMVNGVEFVNKVNINELKAKLYNI